MVFHPKGAAADAPRPTAQVNQNGNFELTTFAARDGAPAGEYAITVEWRKLIVKAGYADPGPNVLPPQYSAPQTTILQARVVEGPNELPQITIVR